MIDTFLEGAALGLVVSITIGPAFFAIIQTGIDRGFSAGFFMALGIAFSDMVLIGICYLGASRLFDNPENKIYIGLVGGILLIIFGFATFNRKPEILMRRSGKYKTPKKPGPVTYFFKGFFINFLNPFLIIFWLTAMGWVSSRAEEGKLLSYILTFFGGTISIVFIMDLIKSFIGGKIKKYLRPRIIFWINRLVGVSLMIFGIVLIVRSVITWV